MKKMTDNQDQFSCKSSVTVTANLLFGERAETQPQQNDYFASWRGTFAHSRTEWFAGATDDVLRPGRT